MTLQPAKQSFIPTSIILPDTQKDKEHNLILTDYLKKIIGALNDKDIAQYVTQEVLNGQKFFTPNDNNRFRDAFRIVINFGALPNTASTSVAHGITVDANTTFTRIYGTSSSPASNLYIPLPFSSSTLSENIKIEIDATNVIITTGDDKTAFTVTYVILEYVKN